MRALVIVGAFCTFVGGSRLADIGPAADFELVEPSGKTFAFRSLRGKSVVVSFIFTTCNGSCPLTTQNLVEVQKRLEKEGLWKDSVEFVSITLDPERDDPDVLKRYARGRAIDLSTWHFLTGKSEQVHKVIKAWDMWAKIGPTGVLDHPSRIFLIDAKGRQREIYNLESITPEAVLADVRLLRDEAGQ